MGDWMSPEPAKDMDDGLDFALEAIGGPRSKFTWKVFLLTTLSGVINIWVIISWVFMAHDVDFRCTIPDLDAAGFTHEQQKNLSLVDPEGPACEVLEVEYDNFYNKTFEEAQSFIEPLRYDLKTVPCHRFTFVENRTSIVQEFSMVCNHLHMKSDIQMVVALGKLTGSFIFGVIADKYGRKAAFMGSSIAFMLFGPIQAFIPSYWFMSMCRFLCGAASSGCYNSGVTLTLEVVRKEWREFFGILYNMSYAIGYVSLSLIAYYIRRWTFLQMSLSFPAFFLILSCLLLPESPKWLATKGRRSKAWEVIKSADSNRKPMCYVPDNKPEMGGDDDARKQMFKNFETLIVYDDLRWRLVIALVIWLFVALGYYTIALNSENFATNRYVYVAVSGLVEACCYVLPIPLLRYIGRRGTSCGLFFVCGASLILIPFIPESYSGFTLPVAMIGRLCNGAVYAVIVLFTSELFPTSDRSTAIGMASTMSHVGGIVAPYIVVNAAVYDRRVPGYICAGASFFAAYLVMLYPETRGKQLRDTVEEMKEDAKRGEKVSCANPYTLTIT